MSKLCIINTIKTKIRGNATSYIERENEIFIPKSDNFTLEQTYKIAVKKVDKINQEYLSEKFGKVVSLNTSASNGTGIKIHPSQLLIDAYEVKEGNKSIEELNPRNLEYFNGDEALFEQEQNDELKPFIDESKKIADEIKDVEQQDQEEKIIKQGVSELFEENPELANSVYSALNFKVNKHVNKKYYDSYNNSLKLFSKGKNLNILNNIPFNIINAPNHIKEKYQVATTISEKIWEDDVIGEFKDFSDSVFLKIKYDEEYGTFDLFKSTKFNEFSKEYELIEEDLSYNIIKKLLSYSSPALTYMEEQAKITQQQKATAQQLYSQYLEQNPNGSVEQFKSWVDEFNRKTNLEKTSENKTIEELYKENPKLEEFINSVTDEDNTTLSLYKVKNLLNQKGEGRIVKLNNILYNAIMRLWDNNVFAQNNIKIYFVDSLPENAVGNFNRDDNEITIDKTKFLNIVNNSYQQDEIFYLGYILNHEIIHYLTPNDLSLKIEYIDRALEGRFGKTFELPSEKEFGKNIKELYDIANSQIEDVSDYGFTNLAEFVAEAMSNPNFQEKLASVPYKSTKKSLWKRFIEIVSAYLTKYTGKPINDTLLEAVLAEVTNYITENSNIQKTYKIRNKKNDVFFDFVFTTQKNINSLSDFISQKSQERLIQIEEVFNENPDFSSQIYEALGFNQLITSNDKIVFGHPGIGKTFAKKYNDFIDVDEDYKEEHTMQKILRANAKNTGKKEDLKEWENYVTVWWNKVKTDAKKSGKQIFVSNLPILRMFSQDFDKVITMSKDTFTSRAKQRNDYIEGETEDWKNSLDIEIAKIDKSKVFNTDKYLSNLFITTQQKQQAISKFQEYVNATGRQDIEGFKEFVNRKEPEFNISKKQELQNLPNNKWFRKVIQPVINRFSKMFPNIRVNVISINEIPKEVQAKVDGLGKQINSFYHKGQVYIIKERVSKDITIEEFLHPFVNALEKDNPELFKSLLKEAKELFPDLKDRVFTEYDKVYDSIFDKNREFLTQALTQKVSDLLPEQQTWFDKFKNWLKSILDKMFGNDFVQRDISQLDENMSLTELASVLAENNTSFDIKGDEVTYYSLSNEEVDGYLNTPNISPLQKQSLTKVLENNKIIEFQEDTHQYFINPDGEKIELFPVSSFVYTKKFTSDFSEYSNLGNLIHDLAKQVNTSSSTITDILNRFKQSELAEFYKAKGYPDIFLDQMFTSVYDYIKALKLNGSVLVSEVSIGNQENKIAGTIDLLEIKKDGSITIHDFKSKLLGKNSVTTYGKKQTLESKFKSEENNHSKQLTLYAKMLKEILGYDSNIELQIVPLGYVGEGSVTDGVGKFELPTSYDLNNLFYTPINDNTLSNYKVEYLTDFGNKIIPSFIESKATKVKSQEQIDREKILSTLTGKLQNENSVEFEKQLENIFKSVVDIYKKYGSSKDELNKKLYQVFDKDGLFTKTKIQWEEIYNRLSEVGKDDPEQIKYYLATVVQYINYIEEMSLGIKNIRNNFVKIVNNEEKLSNQEVLSLMKKSFDLAQVNKTAISNTLYELKDEDENNLFVKYLKNALSDIEGIENEYFRRSLPLISETLNRYFSEEDKQRMIDEYSQRLAKAKYDADNSTGSARDKYLAEVEKWQKMIDLLPSPNIIAKVIQGEFGDSDWFFSNLFANINNDDYVIAGTEKYMQDIMRDLSKIARINEEKMGKAHDDLVKALGVSKDTPKALNEDLVYEVKQLHRKSDGSTETTVRLTYITDVDQNVYYEEDVLKHKVDTTEGDEKIKAKKELSDFRKKYYESKYSPNYQKVLDSIDVVVSDGRNGRNVKDVYNEVMQTINDIHLRNNIRDFNEGNWEDSEYTALREAWRNYNNLYSTFDRNGNKKTGADLEISEILRERRNKLNDFRVKVFNETAWESAKAKKISQLLTKYGSTEEVLKSEEYKEWQSLNTIISPTSEFYEKRKELLEKINELLDKREYKDEKLAIGLKESLNSYWEQMLAITKEYRDFEREIQANDLPESVKNQLIDLERAIDIANNQIKSLREKMSISDSKKLGDLYEQYNSMVEYKTTKYYEDDFERALSEFAILKDLSIAEVKSDNELLNEFKTTNEWFINNHIQKSRYDSTMGESVLTIEPVYYYKVIVPTNPDYIKEQPAAQYSSYELKPEALNPNYLDQFGRPNVRRDSKFVTENFRYLKLKNATDAKGKAKYQAIKHLQSFLEERQKGLDSNNYIYYSVPSKQKTTSERILDDGGKGIYTNFKNKFVRNEQDEKEFGTRSTFTNMAGEEAKFIPVEGKSKIDIKDQSYDIWSAALDYGLSAEKSKLFTKHMPVMEVLLDQLEKAENQPNEEGLVDVLGKSLKDKGLLNVSTSVKGKTNTRLRNVQNIIDRYFYDEWQKELKTVFGVSDVKLTNTLLGAAGSNMMMGNIPNWFVNFASGNIQIMIESAGERYITKKDVASAKSELYTKLKKDMLSDISKTHDKSLIGQLTDYYDPMKGEYLNQYGEKFTWSKRTNLREVLFFGKNLGEYEMQMTVFIAMLKAKKVEQILPDGSKKIISLYEAYEKGDNGLPKLKEGVQFTEEQERNYMNKIHAINKKLNGAYAKMDQTYVENYSIGRLLFFMKKFFLPLWMDRYGKTRGDWELGDVREGHYIAFYNTVLKDLYRLKGNLPEILTKWNKTPEQGGYTELQKQAIKKTFTELAIIATMFVALCLLGYDDGEDDTDAQKYAQYFFLRLRREIAVFTPFVAHQEFIAIFSRPIIAASYIGNTANLISTGIKTALYYPTGWFENDVLYQKKTALFEKGDSKFLALVYKFIGLKINISDPDQLLHSYNMNIRF